MLDFILRQKLVTGVEDHVVRWSHFRILSQIEAPPGALTRKQAAYLHFAYPLCFPDE